MKEKILRKINYILIMLVVFLIGVASTLAFVEKITIKDLSIELGIINPSIEECSNLNLRSTSRCLQNHMAGFYNYKKVNDSESIFEVDYIKENGGDCNEWSFMYQKLSGEIGYNSTKVVISVREGINHAFTIIHDNTGYCILDGKSTPKCMNYGKQN